MAISILNKTNFILMARQWDKDYVVLFGLTDESGEEYEFLEFFPTTYEMQRGKKKWAKLGYSARHVWDVWYNDLIE